MGSNFWSSLHTQNKEMQADLHKESDVPTVVGKAEKDSALEAKEKDSSSSVNPYDVFSCLRELIDLVR